MSARHDFDKAVDQITAKAELVLSAHIELGIPLEDLLCAAIREHFRRLRSDARQRYLSLSPNPQSPISNLQSP